MEEHVIEEVSKFLYWLMEESDYGYCGRNRWGDLDNNEFTIKELYLKYKNYDNN